MKFMDRKGVYHPTMTQMTLSNISYKAKKVSKGIKKEIRRIDISDLCCDIAATIIVDNILGMIERRISQ